MARYDIVWRILTMHCDEASRLTSESLDHELMAADKIGCRLHLMICRDCRRHRRDLVALREIGKQAADPLAVLSDEDRERIKRSLRGD